MLKKYVGCSVIGALLLTILPGTTFSQTAGVAKPFGHCGFARCGLGNDHTRARHHAAAASIDQPRRSGDHRNDR